jgi:hypothetical protein
VSTHELPGFPGMIPAGMEDDGDGGLRPIRDNTSTDVEFDDEFSGIVDYFGSKGTERYLLPDGKQLIEFKRLNEGDRVLFENRTSQDVKFNRRNDDAAIKLDASSSRQQLIIISVVNWHMAREIRGKMQWMPFSSSEQANTRGPGTFDTWMMLADPKVINDLYLAIRKANPFLSDEMTPEMIKEEIGKLEEMLAEVTKRDALGKTS